MSHPDTWHEAFAAEARHHEYLEQFGLPCARCGALHEPTEHELDGKPLCEGCAEDACWLVLGDAIRAVEAELAGKVAS